MTAIKIDNGIPAPGNQFKGRPAKYPFRALAIGQSFLAPAGIVESSFRVLAAYHTRKSGRGFSVRKTSEGLRVWRIS